MSEQHNKIEISEQETDSKYTDKKNSIMFNTSDIESQDTDKDSQNNKNDTSTDNKDINDQTKVEPSKSFQEGIKEKIDDAYNYILTLPLFVRFVCISSTFFWLLLLISNSLAHFFSNIPENVLHKFRIWTIVTGTFTPTGFVNLAICIAFWIHSARNLEKSLSTTRYMLNFLIDSTFTSLFYFIFGVLLFFFSTWPLNGLLAVTMCQNTLLCIANPNVKLSLVFVKIDAKYYPLALSLIMFIMHLGKAFDIFIGIGYAFAYYYLIRIQISDEFTLKFEKFLSFLTKFDSFVSVSDSTGFNGDKEKAQQQIVIQTNNNHSYNDPNKNEISIEKLDKSSDRGTHQGKKLSSNNQVNYINLEDEKTL